MRGARKAAENLGRTLHQFGHPAQEVSDEVLLGQVQLRDCVIRLNTNPDFAEFKGYIRRRITEGREQLSKLKPEAFLSTEGLHDKGKLVGAQSVLDSILAIMAEGDEAERKLKARHDKSNGKKETISIAG